MIKALSITHPTLLDECWGLSEHSEYYFRNSAVFIEALAIGHKDFDNPVIAVRVFSTKNAADETILECDEAGLIELEAFALTVDDFKTYITERTLQDLSRVIV